MGQRVSFLRGFPRRSVPTDLIAILAAHSKDSLRGRARLRDTPVTAPMDCGREYVELHWGHRLAGGEQLWIRHSKTGARSCLPLLRSVGQAILTIAPTRCPPPRPGGFLRLNAPRGAFMTTIACMLLRRILSGLALRLTASEDPTCFATQRGEPLRAGVPLKTIGGFSLYSVRIVHRKT